MTIPPSGFGNIDWTKDNGAFAVYGKIFEYYDSRGADAGYLGLPTSDEHGFVAQSVSGRESAFEKGVICWAVGWDAARPLYCGALCKDQAW